MQNELNPDAREAPQAREGMSSFRKSLLITAIPVAILCLASLALPIVWLFAAIFIAFALLIGLILLLIGERGIASGVFAGVGIGILVLGVTCFANAGRAW